MIRSQVLTVFSQNLCKLTIMFSGYSVFAMVLMNDRGKTPCSIKSKLYLYNEFCKYKSFQHVKSCITISNFVYTHTATRDTHTQ